MNLPEFKALKAAVVERAATAVERYGVPNPIGRSLVYEDVQVHYARGEHRIIVIEPNKRTVLVYREDVNGDERRVGLSRRQLADAYQVVLNRLQRQLVLDELARI